MVYHDASREGVNSCWSCGAEPPLRQSIIPPRSSGTVTIPDTTRTTLALRATRHRHHAAGHIRSKHPHPQRRYPYPDVVTLNARQHHG